MNKIALATSFAVLLINSSALAETWSVSERLVSGINYASGTWNLNMQPGFNLEVRRLCMTIERPLLAF